MNEGKNKKTILIFGNLFVREDNLGLVVMGNLQKKFKEFNFVEVDPTEELTEYGRDLFIVDAVMGIENCREVEFKSENDFLRLELMGGGMHDFDLGYNLRLLKKVGKIDSARILCVPMAVQGREREKIYLDICLILKGWSK